MDKQIYTSLFEKLDDQSVVITPNRRLSVSITKHYQQFHIEQDHNFWETPKILPLSSYIKLLWNEVWLRDQESPLLLNAAQVSYIWNDLIKADQHHFTLSTSETADMAIRTWRQLHIWEIDLEHPDFNTSQDYLSFKIWAKKFNQICKKNNWIDEASLFPTINKNLENEKIKISNKIYILGFTELTPQMISFIRQCKKLRSLVEIIELPSRNLSCHRVTIKQRDDEIILAARYALEQIRLNKHETIACVIPDLDQRRDRVEQLFSYVFKDEFQTLINISAGKPLTQYPIIAIIFNILHLTSESITLDEFSKIILSSFVGEANKESYLRSKYINHLKKKNIINLDLKSLLNEKSERSQELKQYCPFLFKRLNQLAQLIATHNKSSLTCHEWSKHFHFILNVWGWPGELSLESNEYQIIEQWFNLLNTFSSIDYVANAITQTQALHILFRIANLTMFQAKSPETSIHILGTLEAAGQSFDHLWMTGMDDLAWPPQPKPDPFIPRTIQQKLQISHASSEREYEFCQLLQNQLISHSQHIIFSHSQSRDDIQLSVSSLIAHINQAQENYFDLPPFMLPSVEIYRARSFDLIHDYQAPTITVDEKIKGGIEIIKNQALCPFKAFATHRLFAKSPETLSIGVKKSDRGKVIHHALELFWKDVLDQDTLIKLSLQDCETLLDKHITTAFHALQLCHSSQTKLIQLEILRMKKLLLDWLVIEKEREPFEVISLEKRFQVNINTLSIETRIDRIDKLADNTFLIIDYKSGKYNEVSSWFGNRPEDPQLPFYATFTNQAIHGLAYAQVSPTLNSFKGIHQHATAIKGLKTINEIKYRDGISWLDQQTAWRTHIEKITSDFISGYAHTDPKDQHLTCERCHLHPLCRINEELT